MPDESSQSQPNPPSSAADAAEPIELFELDEYVDSFNWRIVVGAIFVGFVMLPGAIYMGLVTGQSLTGAAEWVTIILFIEIGKRSFIRMSKQEIIILFGAAAGMVAMGAKLGSAVNLFGGPFGGLIWDQYLAQSPQAENLGIADKIPWWLVPQDREILRTRSFLHRAWAVPVAILCTHAILSVVVNLSLGYVMYRITNDIERLPFPLAPVFAGGATALAESSQKKETWRWRVFSVGAVVGIGFGLLYVVLPTITGAFSPKPLMILPIPFGDATDQIGTYLPAALLGYGFDLTLVMIGFILPFRLVLGMFIASIGCQVLLNPILYHYGVLRQWTPGFSVIPTAIVNGLDFYISVGIGVAIAVAGVGIVSIIRVFTSGPHARPGRVPPRLGYRPLGRLRRHLCRHLLRADQRLRPQRALPAVDPAAVRLRHQPVADLHSCPHDRHHRQDHRGPVPLHPRGSLYPVQISGRRYLVRARAPVQSGHRSPELQAVRADPDQVRS
ncbi:MAG: hypothetical protein ACE5K7_08170, partial [Phycisphaerae bacterium]